MSVFQCDLLLPFLALHYSPELPITSNDTVCLLIVTVWKSFLFDPSLCTGTPVCTYILVFLVIRTSVVETKTLLSTNSEAFEKISFEVLKFLLQGWLQLHFLMARTARMFKWKKGFQVTFCICILYICFVLLDFGFFDVMCEAMSLCMKLVTTQALNFKLALRALN